MLNSRDQSVTILSTNIIGYVNLCETNDDLTILHLLNETYFPSIHSNATLTNGYIDKAIADRQIVFWKSTNKNNNAKNACSTALNIICDYKRIASEKMIPNYKVTICITTGICLVDNKSSLILGNTCNLNSALLNYVNNYGIEVLIDEQTNDLVKNHYLTREIDTIKTVSGYMSVFELILEKNKLLSIIK